MAGAVPASCTPETWAGLACHRLCLPNGDAVRVAEHGAHVLSWTASGRERLFLSASSAFDGLAPIRGGIPVCWPQFNQRGPLPKHGFARQSRWRPGEARVRDDAIEFDLHLEDGDATRALWPVSFQARFTVRLEPARLKVSLELLNPGPGALTFTGALHTYLAVDEVTRVEVSGLQGQPEWDSLTDMHGRAESALRFREEFDRVYAAPRGPIRVTESDRCVTLSQSPEWAEVVVWNPGPFKGESLPDMAPGGWRRMLCVEAAQVFEPVVLSPGARWQGWQALDLG
jgi:glucose-6-phosphate 1-epimerase